MYIDGWDEFSFRAKELFIAQPLKVRYTFKYRHTDQNFVVKVTDDRVCLKYKTDQLGDVKKLDKLNAWFMRQSISAEPSMIDAEEDDEEQTKRASTSTKKGGKKTKRKK